MQKILCILHSGIFIYKMEVASYKLAWGGLFVSRVHRLKRAAVTQASTLSPFSATLNTDAQWRWWRHHTLGRRSWERGTSAIRQTSLAFWACSLRTEWSSMENELPVPWLCVKGRVTYTFLMTGVDIIIIYRYTSRNIACTVGGQQLMSVVLAVS